MSDTTAVTDRGLRSIAFYLPQYHPIPENDTWWGPGFTEWTNVAKARPQFRGHYQPHLPADLGFYDLRVPETRAHQAEIAQAYGIDAFCYYHYWFHGRRLLERPFREVLSSDEPAMPFLLCWANERWTRTWDGGNDQVLIDQTYSLADDIDHIRWLAPAFADDRYLRIDGRPVFLVYAASTLPEPRRTTDGWRAEAQRLGVGDLYLIRVESYREPRGDPSPLGFDAAVEFQPDTQRLGPRVPHEAVRKIGRLVAPRSGRYRNSVHRYRDLVQRSLEAPPPDYKRYRCVTPAWDNSARRDPALILTGATPEAFQRWTHAVAQDFRPFSPQENLMFVNAWNEWAEGNHLEPCRRYGYGFLEAYRNGMGAARQSAGRR